MNVAGLRGVDEMFFRRLLNDEAACASYLLDDEAACASYLLGLQTHNTFGVVDPHVDLDDDYISLAEGHGAAIAAVLDTHVQADHLSGRPELVARTGATAYLPERAGVDFDHHALRDGEVIELGKNGDRGHRDAWVMHRRWVIATPARSRACDR